MSKNFRKLTEANKDKYGFLYTLNNLKKTYERFLEYKKFKGNFISNDILKFKNSDTIYILGSGPSINDIEQSHWEKIANSDSIGFNYWIIHDFIPTFYLFQLSSRPKFRKAVYDFLKHSSKEYSKVPFIIRGDEGFSSTSEYLSFLGDKNEIYFLREYAIHSKCDLPTIELLFFFEAMGMLSVGTIGSCVPKIRASINLLIALCFIMGYKNIILCGIDMKNSNHFWDFGKYKEKAVKYGIDTVSQFGNLHTFTDKKYNEFTVEDIIYTMKDYMSNYGVNLYVANENTVLYPKIPALFPLNDLKNS
jgi:hypothetical protein